MPSLAPAVTAFLGIGCIAQVVGGTILFRDYDGGGSRLFDDHPEGQIVAGLWFIGSGVLWGGVLALLMFLLLNAGMSIDSILPVWLS
ncbi:MAG: hypothetical protein LBE25_05055 [Arthrobacter sp.]|nr:hypothetical protein [Arthrobacter sp.]